MCVKIKSKFNENTYIPETGKIVESFDMTDREKFFSINLPKPFENKPGQFVMVSIPGIGEAPISISSGPRDDGIIEIVVRKVGRLTNIVHKLNVGDKIGIRGPFGSGFDIGEMYGHDLLFVCGGLGLVPLRSLIIPVLEQYSRFGTINIITGSRNPAEVLYGEELNRWSEEDNVKITSMVDQTNSLEWKGGIGLVTEPIKNIRLNKNTIAVLCGPPVMYKFVLMELQIKGLPNNQIFIDLERRMKCGIGKCGHCQINDRYCCQDGPVFRLSDVENLKEALT